MNDVILKLKAVGKRFQRNSEVRPPDPKDNPENERDDDLTE